MLIGILRSGGSHNEKGLSKINNVTICFISFRSHISSSHVWQKWRKTNGWPHFKIATLPPPFSCEKECISTFTQLNAYNVTKDGKSFYLWQLLYYFTSVPTIICEGYYISFIFTLRQLLIFHVIFMHFTGGKKKKSMFFLIFCLCS